ncbi:hypothetical protein [Nocardia brasiliensis]|uniref:hypothetical protein n=1 Tax=Nocardia brasiliensis TaxID=37326 RepID=UPI0018955F82|nr:hypothetical protein [Nocardia brasiliensis]MBF6126590.1 hypothetical protein [Nocardia brasiliensis]
MQKSQGVSLDLNSVASYARAMDRVAEQLEAASVLATNEGLTEQRLAADLGPIGHEFARAFTAAVTVQSEALSLGSRLVTTYASTLRDYVSRMSEVDSGTAAAIRAAELEI